MILSSWALKTDCSAHCCNIATFVQVKGATEDSDFDRSFRVLFAELRKNRDSLRTLDKRRALIIPVGVRYCFADISSGTPEKIRRGSVRLRLISHSAH